MQGQTYKFFMNSFRLMNDLEVVTQEKQKSEKMVIATSRLATQAEMTANLAHEINSPLSVIKLKMEQASRNHKKTLLDASSVSELIEKTTTMVERIENIIHSTKRYFYQDEKSLSFRKIDSYQALEELLSFFN